MRTTVLGLILGLLSLVSALSAAGNKLLVIEEDGEKSKYSHFWSDLTERGLQITYHTPKDTSLSLFLHGEPAYSHLILLPTKSKGLGPALTPKLLVDFVNNGSNILLALSSEHTVPSAIGSLLLEMDINLSPDRNSVVVDHFNYDTKTASDKHDVLLLPRPTFSENIENFFEVNPYIALPRAVGQVLGNASPLLSPVLIAPSTAYMYDPKEDSTDALEDAFATGSQISLVSTFQARNSARFTVLGSAEALEDKWFTASVQLPGPENQVEKTTNRDFFKKLSAWTFQELGVLKVENIRHWLNEGPQKNLTSTNTKELGHIDLNPSIYRIKNAVRYEVAVSEWVIDRWMPFQPPSTDALQLEISMLSPFHRLNLQHTQVNEDSAIYAAEFTLPDQHGIFNFLLEHRRPFYTNVEAKRTVTVRHFAHDEWPRSFVISGAWPWISGIWVTVIGWVGFVALWLYSKPAQVQRELKAGGGKR